MTKVNILQQVPSHVAANYPAFTEFVQAYYDWLTSEYFTNNLETVVDIEKTPQEFITYFKQQLARDIPEEIHCCRRLFYQRIKDLYTAKGTESAYKLLFRLVYGQETDIVYPSEQILRASDGRWKQDISIFVTINYGDINSIFEKSVTIQTSSNRFAIYIKRLVKITDTVYEVFVDKQYSGVISVGDYIITSTVRATVLTTLDSVKILSGGAGFKIGEIFTISSPSGTPSVVKVMDIGSNGSLKRVQLIKFGYGYESSFISHILSSKNSNISVTPPFTESSPSGVNSSEYYYDITEKGVINRQTYLQTNTIESPAWDPTYAGEIVGEFIYDNNQSNIDESLYAKLSITTGAIAKYPGYYTSNNGFLNDSIYIQDSYYYQHFSYVVRINQQLDSYKELLKSTLHPTGLALFGEFDILNKFKLDIRLNQTGQTIALILSDQIAPVDTINSIQFNKKLDEIQLIEESIEKLITADKYSTLDETNVSDSGQIIYSTPNDYGSLIYSTDYFETQSAPIALDDWFLYSGEINEDLLWLDKVSWDF